MDKKALELYLEEQRASLIKLEAVLNRIEKVFDTTLKVAEQDKPSVQEITGSVEVNTQDSVKITNINEFVKGVELLTKEVRILRAQAEESRNKPITVANIKEARATEVRVQSLEAYTDSILELSEAVRDSQPIVNVEKQEIVWPTDPKQPISVRLSDGKSFYRALTAAFSGASGVQGDLIRQTDNGKAIAVVNPDGSTISGGGGGSTEVTNFPDHYPLPDDQQTILENIQAYTGNTSSYLAEAADGTVPLYTKQKPTDGFAISNIDSVDATYKYIGFENKDGAWYIMRKTLASNVFLYAAGASSYSSAWTGRAGQTYASYGVTF